MNPNAAELERSDLELLFLDEAHHLGTGDSLTFGRAADLQLDTNRSLHRLAGRIVERDGVYWLQNLGSQIPLEVVDDAGITRYAVAPGQQVALCVDCGKIRLAAGRSRYELEYRIHCSTTPAMTAEQSEYAETATVLRAEVPLTANQHLLLVALCEPVLLGGRHELSSLPKNAEYAARLGWQLSRFNRKLDNVAAKFATKAGLQSLVGSNDCGRAVDRRRLLIDYALTTELVTLVDLRLLDGCSP